LAELIIGAGWHATAAVQRPASCGGRVARGNGAIASRNTDKLYKLT
jgi:hypothetical protein